MEGRRAVLDAVDTGIPLETILVREQGTDEVAADPRLPAFRIRRVDATVFDRLSGVEHSQGIMAIVGMDALPAAEPVDAASLLVIADGIRDPGNLGTLLRSAAGGGVSEVILTPTTVDPFNPKCVRASMGALFRVPIAALTFDETAARVRSVPTVAMADARGAAVYTEVDWTAPSAIIVGSEAEGISPRVRALATASVRIPLSAGMESLNAGVAGSLLIFEAARQRRQAR